MAAGRCRRKLNCRPEATLGLANPVGWGGFWENKIVPKYFSPRRGGLIGPADVSEWARRFGPSQLAAGRTMIVFLASGRAPRANRP